ncbi:MAG: hypothetical protein ABI175_30865, partial [Polyangiales bacterium]
MSIKSKLLWLGLGGGLIAMFVKDGRRRAAAPSPAPAADAIPSDPEVEAALDLQSLDVDDIELGAPEMVSLDAMEQPAHRDNDEAMESGQNWL